MVNYEERPSMAPARLAEVTNVLARWLPLRPSTTDETAVSAWGLPEWEAAEWVTYWQNGLPWLVQRIRETDVDVPEPVRSRLFQLDADSRERTRRMLDACVELLGAFEQVGIAAMPFKGAVLAPLYYDDPLLRPMADLDILIEKQDLAQSVAILKQLGYRFYSNSAEDEVYLRGDRKSNIWAPDNVHPVEIHFTLREEYAGIGYNLADLMWANGEKRPFWQEYHATLPKLPMLLHHVCAHATSDWLIQRGRLMHIDDISKLAARMSGEDWAWLQTAVSPSHARFVYPALMFVRKYTAVDIPTQVNNYLRHHCPPALLNWIAATELADTSESNPTPRSGIGFDLAQRLALSKADQIRFWLRSLFPRRWNLSKRYPRLVKTPFWPLAYLFINFDRILQIIKKRS